MPTAATAILLGVVNSTGSMRAPKISQIDSTAASEPIRIAISTNWRRWRRRAATFWARSRSSLRPSEKGAIVLDSLASMVMAQATSLAGVSHDHRSEGVEHDCAFLRRPQRDRKSTRLNSSHQIISYAVFCLKKKKQ